MIIRAKTDENFYIGLNRDRINKGQHIHQQTKKLGTNAGSVIVQTNDVRAAKDDPDIGVDLIQSKSTLQPPLDVGPPEAFHPSVVNTSFIMNTLVRSHLYFPQFNNIGLRTTIPEFYYVIHGSGNFTPPVYVTNWGDKYE